MKDKHNIFVSYSRKDKSKVFPLIERINKVLGEKCWIDLEGIESGEQFENVIIKAIDNCKVVLFMLSESSLKSEWAQREVYYAEGEKKRIVPILIEGDKLRGWFKFHFGNVDFIDIRSEEQKGKLVRNLKTWLSTDTSETGKEEETAEAQNEVPKVAMGTGRAYDTDEEREKHVFVSNHEYKGITSEENIPSISDSQKKESVRSSKINDKVDAEHDENANKLFLHKKKTTKNQNKGALIIGVLGYIFTTGYFFWETPDIAQILKSGNIAEILFHFLCCSFVGLGTGVFLYSIIEFLSIIFKEFGTLTGIISTVAFVIFITILIILL